MKLVDDAREAWRWWSVRAAALAGFAASAIVADPRLLTSLLAYVPEDKRPLASAITGLIVFAAPTLLRLLKQKEPANG